MTPIDLQHELADRAPVPCKVIAGAYIYYDQTPAHEYTTVIAPIVNGDYYLALPSRDFFDEQFATGIFAFVATQSSTLSGAQPLVILEDFAYPGYAFDCIAVLSPFAAKQYEYENETLNQRTFVAFPIYRCELSGNESADLINVIRHDFLSSLDWKRSPIPKILIAFGNKQKKKKKGRCIENGFVLTTFENALAVVDHLAESKSDWLSLENYRGQQCRITWNIDHYNIELPDRDTIQCTRSPVIEFIRRFTSSGC